MSPLRSTGGQRIKPREPRDMEYGKEDGYVGVWEKVLELLKE